MHRHYTSNDYENAGRYYSSGYYNYYNYNYNYNHNYYNPTPTPTPAPAPTPTPTPTPSTSTGTGFQDGPYYVDALMWGQSWTGTVGKAATVHYTATNLTSAELTGLNLAMQQWENVANIDFVKATSGSQLTISEASLSGMSGITSTSYSGTTFTKVTVKYDSSYTSNPTVGTDGFTTMMHELGHSLGLKHPGNYNSSGSSTPGPFLPTSEDSLNASIMSYNDGSLANYRNSPTSPMIYDIAAAQYLYGANTSYNSGDTTYSFNGTKNAMTIWDGGGNDTLASTYTGNTTIDLREGLSNVSKIGSAAIWIAFNAHIENATGGKGNDTIYGNTLNNVLTGGQGNDTMTGGAGNDTFYFHKGDGVDIIKDFQHHSGTSGDTIAVDSSIYSTVSQVMSALSSSTAGAVLNLGSGQSVTLSGINSATLTSSDFLIG